MASIDTKDFTANYNREKWEPLNAHDYFLTYSRCPVPKEQLEELILKKINYNLKENFISFIVVAHELHEEAHESKIMDHLHAYIRFNKKQYVKSPKFFDYKFKGKDYHPQVGTVNNPIGCMRYTLGLVEKKGNVIGDVYSRGVSPIDFISINASKNTPTSPKSISTTSSCSSSVCDIQENKKKSYKQSQKDEIFKKLMNHEITLIEALDIIPTLLTSFTSLKKNLEKYWL
jgi:hypothetical protein